MSRFILVIILGFLAGFWEISVRPFLPSAFQLHPLLPLIVLLMNVSSRPRLLAAAIAGAFILDLFAITAPDLALLRYAGIILILDLFARHLLTNRSLYSSLGLVLIGRVLEYGSAWVIGHFLIWLGIGTIWVRQPSFFISCLWDVLFVGIGFLLMAAFTRRSSVTIRGSASWYE